MTQHIYFHSDKVLEQFRVKSHTVWPKGHKLECKDLSVLSVLQLEIKSWLVTGDSLSMELLKTEKGNTTVALSRLRELQNTSASHHKTVRPSLKHKGSFIKLLITHEPHFNIMKVTALTCVTGPKIKKKREV